MASELIALVATKKVQCGLSEVISLEQIPDGLKR